MAAEKHLKVPRSWQCIIDAGEIYDGPLEVILTLGYAVTPPIIQDNE